MKNQEHAFPFHYGQEAEQYSFYRIPKVLFTEPVFQKLSTDAKVLYGLLLDRMQLSVRNQWFEEDGRVFIYFRVESIMVALDCGNKKASRLLAELDDNRGIGLITRVHQGLGKPDKIFVHKCVLPKMSIQQLQRCQNDMSGSVKMTGQEMSKGHTNDTKLNNTEWNENESIYQPDGEWMDEDIAVYEKYRDYFTEQLCMEALLMDYPYERDVLYEMLELLVETVSSNRKTIRISGEEKPAQIVKSRLMKINSEHIRYVLQCMHETTTRIRNIRQYLLAALYNAPATISSFYSAQVNHDLYGRED